MKRASCTACLLCPAIVALAVAACPDAQAAVGATVNVTTTADEYDLGVPNATCSLREAVQSSNDGADRGGCTHAGSYAISTTIVLGATTYSLTRIGIDDDANVSSDLDISHSVTISGNIAGTTIVTGGNNYSGRIMHVLGGTVQLKNLTLQNGSVPSGRSGGGLLTESGTTTTLTAVTVTNNSADHDGGGVLNRGTMTLNASTVSNNHTLNSTEGGGGLFNDVGAQLTLNDSRVLSNIAHGPVGGGGGIRSASNSILTVDNTTVADNTVEVSQTNSVNTGGGIYTADSAQFLINRSTVNGNSVVGLSGTVTGGGMDLGGVGRVSYTLISGNTATDAKNALGGGAVLRLTDIVLADSVIDGNSVDGGTGSGTAAGIQIGSSRVLRSTISNNIATGSNSNSCGGGVAITQGGLIDSTVVNNQTDGTGGGVCVFTLTATTTLIANTTITGNTSNADNSGGGAGGGMSVLAGTAPTPQVTNTVIAGNLEAGSGTHNDCDGTITSLGQTLVQDISGCVVVGGAGNLINVDPLLDVLADNGGPIVGASNATVTASMLTRLPLNGSPLIDAGDPSGCKDSGKTLTVDQRGFLRAVDGPDGDATETCDIGAVEFASFLDPIFIDGFE